MKTEMTADEYMEQARNLRDKMRNAANAAEEAYSLASEMVCAVEEAYSLASEMVCVETIDGKAKTDLEGETSDLGYAVAEVDSSAQAFTGFNEETFVNGRSVVAWIRILWDNLKREVGWE